MTGSSPSRRSFLASLGALSAAGLAPRGLLAGDTPAIDDNRLRTDRGIALDADDFGFAPGLVYLQTGSLGPTPRPVMDHAIAVWKQLAGKAAPGSWKGKTIEVQATPQLVQSKYMNLTIAEAAQLRVL